MTSEYGVSISWMLCRVCLPAMPAVSRKLTETAVCPPWYVSSFPSTIGTSRASIPARPDPGISRESRARRERPRECGDAARRRVRRGDAKVYAGGTRLRGGSHDSTATIVGHVRRAFVEARRLDEGDEAFGARASDPSGKFDVARRLGRVAEREWKCKAEPTSGSEGNARENRAANPSRPFSLRLGAAFGFILCNSRECIAALRERVVRACVRTYTCAASNAVAIFAFALAFRNRYQLHIWIQQVMQVATPPDRRGVASRFRSRTPCSTPPVYRRRERARAIATGSLCSTCSSSTSGGDSPAATTSAISSPPRHAEGAAGRNLAGISPIRRRRRTRPIAPQGTRCQRCNAGGRH